MNKLECDKPNVITECLRQQKCSGKSVAGGVGQGWRSNKLATLERVQLKHRRWGWRGACEHACEPVLGVTGETALIFFQTSAA